MTSLIKALPQIVLLAALLAVVTVLGYTGHLAPTSTYNLVMAYIGAVGIAGAIVLGSSAPNSDTYPHLILAVLVLAAVAVLGIHNVFSDNQIQAVLALLIGAGALAGGTVLGSSTSTPSA